MRARAPGGRARRDRSAGNGHLRPSPAGVVRVPDGSARNPGASLRGTDRGADRRRALTRVRGYCAGRSPRRSSGSPPDRGPRQIKDAIIARRGKETRNIAKVAAARELLTLVFYDMRDGRIRRLAKPRSAA